MGQKLEIPLVRRMFEKFVVLPSFSDINDYLHSVHRYKTLNPPILKNQSLIENTFNYSSQKDEEYQKDKKKPEDDRGNICISGKIIPLDVGGIVLGLERSEKYPNILGSFCYERIIDSFNVHLEPVFLRNKEIPEYILSNLERIKNGTFNFNYLEEGEYLKRETEIALEHTELLPLEEGAEEGVILLELYDLDSKEINEINKERFRENKPVVEFTKPYQKGRQLIGRLPPNKRTPTLERRLTSP